MPCVPLRRKRKKQKFIIDNKFKAIVESKGASLTQVQVRFKLKKICFADNIVLSEYCYNLLKKNLPEVKKRLDHIRFDLPKAQNKSTNMFLFCNELSVIVRLEKSRVFVDFSSRLLKRDHYVTLNAD